HHKRKRDNRQVHNSIRKKRNNGQRQRKCHDACFCHHKCRRWDIKPQECKNTSNNHKAERGDVNLILIKGDEPICSKNGGKNSSRQTIDSINNTGRKESYRNEDKKEDEEKCSDYKISIKWNIDRTYTKLIKEPYPH